MRASLFSQTDALLGKAQEAGAELLSPDNYAAAMERYTKATDMFERNKSIEAIRSELAKSQSALREAIEQTALAKVTLEELIRFREAAVAANAETFAPAEWSAAEAAFASAARGLEGGDVKRAETRAAKAIPLVREAELVAIQTAILGEARRLVAEGEDNDVDRYAPETYAQAENLVQRAEQLLVDNRYDTSPAIRLAVAAEYEARHAAHLASQARRLKDKAVTPEQLILEWEKPLAAIATALETSTDFSNGYEVPAEASLARIAAAAAIAEENTILNMRVVELEEQLSLTTERAKASELRLQQVRELENLFRANEARIVQENDQVIIRLIGLNFATGAAVIESQFFALLRKLDQVPNIFPGGSLIVEGHTDAQGSDTMNLALSERRANSVRDYLLAATSLKSSAISAVGYGESRPIANNESADGRAQNRRTDVVIVPAP